MRGRGACARGRALLSLLVHRRRLAVDGGHIMKAPTAPERTSSSVTLLWPDNDALCVAAGVPSGLGASSCGRGFVWARGITCRAVPVDWIVCVGRHAAPAAGLHPGQGIHPAQGGDR